MSREVAEADRALDGMRARPYASPAVHRAASRLRRLTLALAVALSASALVLGGGAAATGCRRHEEPAASSLLPSIRLGMSPRDVRDRFDPGGPGNWRTKVAEKPGEDTVLEWTMGDPKAKGYRIVHATFEFHLGMLVAIRAHVVDPVLQETVEVSPKTVSIRTPRNGDGSDLVVLARDCPTHKDEAEAAAARGPRPKS